MAQELSDERMQRASQRFAFRLEQRADKKRVMLQSKGAHLADVVVSDEAQVGASEGRHKIRGQSVVAVKLLGGFRAT